MAAALRHCEWAGEREAHRYKDHRNFLRHLSFPFLVGVVSERFKSRSKIMFLGQHLKQSRERLKSFLVFGAITPIT